MNNVPSDGAGATKSKAPRVVGVGTHYLRYSTANFLVLVAGFISFPALTRLLDNTQYGILGYFETWVMIAVAVAKLGAQHAILRFYPFGGDQARIDRFATNYFYLPMIVSSVLWLAAILVFACIDWLGEASFSPVLWCAVLAIPLTVFSSLVQMTLRAGEQSGILMITRVAARWLELVLMLGAVFLIERSALAAYGGKILAAVLVGGFYAWWVRQNLKFMREAVDLGEFKSSLKYGLPLISNEIATVLLISIDRVMLKGMLGDFAAVGIYSIGYGLALQVSIFMHGTVSESFIPVANRTYETEGVVKLRELKSRILMPMTYASVGVAVAIWCVGSDALQAISGVDKAASGPVFAWIGTMYALYPLLDISGYGLLLHKRSMTVLVLTFLSAALNIGINLWLIPLYGIMGAVYATAVSYGFLGVAICVMCPRELLRFPDARTLLTAGAAGAAFVIAVYSTALFGLVAPWSRLFVAGGLWLLLYVLPVLLLDGRLRRMLPKPRSRLA